MNGKLPEDQLREATREEIISALFANMVIQRSQTALIFLGRAPNPEGGPPIKDLEAAKHFIDELEMLGEKTKGNLNKQEEQLLKQSLSTLRMIFVQEMEGQVQEEQAAEQPGSGFSFQFAPTEEREATAAPSMPTAAPAPQAAPESKPAPQPTPPSAAASKPAEPEPDPESRKRFVKKY